jgi:hypothetical protein
LSSDQTHIRREHLTKWAGPALVILASAGGAALALQPPGSGGTVSSWILSSALAPERVIPLVGLGAALSLVSLGHCMGGVALFAAGFAAGFPLGERLVSLLANVPGAVNHLFFTGPISCIAAGLVLVSPAGVRPRLLPLSAAAIGVMLALAIKLTDPTLHDPMIRGAGALVGLWMVASVLLTGRAFRQKWFDIAGRILGSWLLAIGLLYGSASFIAKQTPLPNGPASSSAVPIPNPDNTLPGLGPSEPARPDWAPDQYREP